MKKLSIILVLLLLNYCAKSQIDTIEIGTIEINGSRTAELYSESARMLTIITKETIRNTSAQSLNELLENTLSLDIRQRGADEVQADMKTRAGSFEQTLILLNGIKINDPQTGHHNLNIPISLEDIERIEVLSGPAARTYGANAFSGAINVITSNSQENILKARISTGQNNYLNGGFSAHYNYEKYQSYISLSKKRSDGYIQNTDFNIKNLFYTLKNIQDFGSFTLQLAYKDKSFGAQSFYTPKYPNQYEQVKTSFGSIAFDKKGNIRIKSHIYARRNQDRFELFRSNAASWYKNHNYHLTDTYGADANFSFSWNIFKTAIGTEFRSENILSNVLGENLNDTIAAPGEPNGFFTKKAQRNSYSLFLEEGILSNKFAANIGFLAIYYSDFKWKTYGGIDISYEFAKNTKWFASANQSLRLPSFTDLYYEGPSNIGNPNLIPEEAITYETGLKVLNKGVDFQTSIFQRKGKNIIDWVRLNDSILWQSKNLTELTTQGINIQTNIKLFELINQNLFLHNIQLSYAYNEVKKYSGEYESNYALDFLKNNITSTIVFQLQKYLHFSIQISYQDRNGKYSPFDFENNTYLEEEDYQPFTILNTKLNFTKNGINAYITADNLLNKQYFDIGNIEMPGRWIKIGAIYTLKF